MQFNTDNSAMAYCFGQPRTAKCSLVRINCSNTLAHKTETF